jgi:hypothetical protein
MMSSLPSSLRKSIVDTAAWTMKIEHGSPIPPVDTRFFDWFLALWAMQALRVEDAKNKIIALLLIHELDCGKEYHRFLLLFGYRTGTYSGTS